MLKLKLAEYNLETKKFERFLELGKDFLYGGDFIIFTRSSGYFFIDTASQECREQFKDQKDPLNRFNGLFDGITYGQGRFVLVVNDEDDILEIREKKKEIINNKYKIISEKIVSDCFLGYRIKSDFLITLSSGKLIKTKFNRDQIWEESSKTSKIVGNLHENPELWEKVK
jgi:hypothetical protein